MRDHDEVFRRVMKAKEQYEQQKKEKSMFQFSKGAPGGGARDKKARRKTSSKLFVWGMRAAAALLWVVLIGGIAAAVYFGVKYKNNLKGTRTGDNPTGHVTDTPTGNAAKTSLTMWCTAKEGSFDKVAFERAIDEMRVKYPNVDLCLKTYWDPELELAVSKALQEGTAPDIFCVGNGYVLDDMAAQGQVYCLDGAYAKYTDALPKTMCENVSYNGKLYGVPYMVTVRALFVNRKVLRSVGINEVPSTYDELITCCETLRQNGIAPFGCADEEWCMSEYLETLIIKSAGASALQAIYRNGASWQNRDVAEAIDLYEEFVQKGYFSPADDASGRGNGEVKADFMDGRYAFYLGGSWNCPELAICDDIAVVDFPVIDSADSGAGQFLCGADKALAVNNGSAQKELAAQYAMELGQLVSMYIYLDGAALPAWTVNYDTTGVDALSAQITGRLRQASDFVISINDGVTDSRTVMKYSELIRKAYNREINGTAFTAAMEAFRAEQNESGE
ncbi:MAG: extracellular solute-binding protein [Lachnospiraceae bacterium]|nr:extracellular solute-binding protein [Lachnospiraceae bacterium]